MHQLLSSDVKVMEKKRQDVDVFRFLIGRNLKYESVCKQILDGSDIPSLLEVFSRIYQATLLDSSS